MWCSRHTRHTSATHKARRHHATAEKGGGQGTRIGTSGHNGKFGSKFQPTLQARRILAKDPHGRAGQEPHGACSSRSAQNLDRMIVGTDADAQCVAGHPTAGIRLHGCRLHGCILGSDGWGIGFHDRISRSDTFWRRIEEWSPQPIARRNGPRGRAAAAITRTRRHRRCRPPCCGPNGHLAPSSSRLGGGKSAAPQSSRLAARACGIPG